MALGPVGMALGWVQALAIIGPLEPEHYVPIPTWLNLNFERA